MEQKRGKVGKEAKLVKKAVLHNKGKKRKGEFLCLLYEVSIRGGIMERKK